MPDRVLDIFNRSGDANIGQTLLRLAALAEAARQYQVMDRVMDLLVDADASASTPTTTKPRGAEGIGSRPVVPLARMDAGPANPQGNR
ncbi:MAG: hypothetical protein NTW19_24035 [Planctomycetota bacterium]|nr:hypothetical protein [Planctomycetota bacterium]